MAAELIIAPEAEQDVAEAYAWYEIQRSGLGEEFWAVSLPVSKRSAAPPRCMLSSTRTIAGAWCAVFHTLSSTNMQKAR